MNQKVALTIILGIILCIGIAFGVAMYVAIYRDKTGNGKAPVPAAMITQAEFGVSATLPPASHVSFNDGLLLTFIGVLDSRCAPDVVCVWAGELVYQFHITGGKVGRKGIQFNLSPKTSKMTHSGYTFLLGSPIGESVTITITK